jgi:hypothetical protein
MQEAIALVFDRFRNWRRAPGAVLDVPDRAIHEAVTTKSESQIRRSPGESL